MKIWMGATDLKVRKQHWSLIGSCSFEMNISAVQGNNSWCFFRQNASSIAPGAIGINEILANLDRSLDSYLSLNSFSWSKFGDLSSHTSPYISQMIRDLIIFSLINSLFLEITNPVSWLSSLREHLYFLKSKTTTTTTRLLHSNLDSFPDILLIIQ